MRATRDGSSAAAGSFNCRPTSSPVGLQRGFTQGVRESSDPLMNKFSASSLILPSASNVRHLIKLERVRNAFNFSRPLTNLSTADTISLRQQLWFFLNIDWIIKYVSLFYLPRKCKQKNVYGNCVNKIHCTSNPKVVFDRHYCIQCIEISEYIRSANERKDKTETITSFLLRIRAGPS